MSTLPTWMQLKQRYYLVSCMLEFLVSWYQNGPSSYGLPVIRQASLRINVLWQRFYWHLTGPERSSRKVTEMSRFPFWACMKHSSGKPEPLGQTAERSVHLPPRRGAYQVFCVTKNCSASAVHLFRHCCFQGGLTRGLGAALFVNTLIKCQLWRLVYYVTAHTVKGAKNATLLLTYLKS